MTGVAKLGAEAADDLAEFVARNADCAMFIGNALHRHGIGGSSHPAAARFWGLRDAGRLIAAVSISNAGYLTVVSDGAVAERPWVEFGRAVEDEPFRGINGNDGVLSAFRTALGLDDVATILDRADTHHALSLADLQVPDGPGETRIATVEDLDFLPEWRLAYEIEVLGAANTDPARQEAAERARRMVSERAAAILVADGRPLAMTVFNARIPDAVQVGGVFTPPGLRGRGHARRVVAQHLAMARDEGAQRAVLFAASDSAARAYSAIGFRRIGAYRLVEFGGPARIRVRS